MAFIQNIFWNKDEGRIRTGYRIILLMLEMAIISIPSRFIMSGSGNLNNASLEYVLFRAIYGLIAVLLGIWLITRFVDRRPMSNIGFQFDKSWWIDLSFGLTLGIVLMSSIFLIEHSLSWITISEHIFVMDISGSSIAAIFIFLALFIKVGISEELISRGYLLTNLAEGLNFKSTGPKVAIYISWLLTSVLFGIGHLGNPNATLIAGLNIAAAGIFLGTGYVLTGRLAIPIGVHITWNFFQGNVFGFPVSGINTMQSSKVITIIQGGPEIWTGGAFGPEAGLIGIFAILTGTVFTVFWVRLKDGRIKLHLPLAEPPQLVTPAKSIQEINE